MYTCGRCGGIVAKEAAVCGHCGANLTGIQCQSCKFTGYAGDFPGDRCPKCGTLNLAPGQFPTVVCPNCDASVSRQPKTFGQSVHAGWTCTACGAQMDRHDQVIGTTELPAAPTKSPLGHAFASFALPGLGTMLCGKTRRGLFILGLSAFFLIGVNLLADALIAGEPTKIGTWLAMPVWIWGMVDAYRSATQWNRDQVEARTSVGQHPVGVWMPDQSTGHDYRYYDHGEATDLVSDAGVQATDPVPGWRPDPAGRHENRYFEHGHPTSAVSDAGVTSTDPLPLPADATVGRHPGTD